MNIQIMTMLESLMIVTALSMDAFVASFAYGTNKIKIPFNSVTVINVICSSILAISLFFGTLVRPFIPETVTRLMCFGILMVIGLSKLMDSIVQVIVRRNPGLEKKANISLFGLNFGLQVKPNKEDELSGQAKILSPGEAVSLSIALSLDGLAVGFGAALANGNALQIVIFSLISDMVAVMAGAYIGGKFAEKVPFNLSWLSGALLIVLSFLKL